MPRSSTTTHPVGWSGFAPDEPVKICRILSSAFLALQVAYSHAVHKGLHAFVK